MWLVACGMWHVACGMWAARYFHMWPVACGLWHAACGMRHAACGAARYRGTPHATRYLAFRMHSAPRGGGEGARSQGAFTCVRGGGVQESVAHSRRRTHRCALTVALWHTHVWASGALEARWLCGHAYCGVIIICMIYRVSILRRQIIFWIA